MYVYIYIRLLYTQPYLLLHAREETRPIVVGRPAAAAAAGVLCARTAHITDGAIMYKRAI